MCGRITLKTSSPEISSLFDQLDSIQIPSQEPRDNICPTQDVLVVRNVDSEPQAVMLRWGLVPFWAKDLKVGARMINARSETVFEKPAFRSAVKSKRCAIVVDGFYEWKSIEGRKKKQPYWITRQDHSPWLMAGLWERWRDKTLGDDAPVIETCTVITTAANDFMSELHDRMPVLLEGDDTKFWMDNEFGERTRLESILKPRPWMDFQYIESDPNEKITSAVDARSNREQAVEQRRLF